MKTLVLSLLVLVGMNSPIALAAKGESKAALIAYMRVIPGTEQQFLKLAEDVIEASRAEEGNIVYELHQSQTNPQQFVFYELFRNTADMVFHRNAKHTKDFLKKALPITVPNGFTIETYDLKSELEQGE